MARTPSGTITSVATVLAPAKTITGISNAAEAVVNTVAHGYTAGDIVLVFSSWGRLNYRAFKVKNPTADAFTLQECDTRTRNSTPLAAVLARCARSPPGWTWTAP